MNKCIFIELGFISCKAEQPLLMKDFVLKYFLEVKAVARLLKHWLRHEHVPVNFYEIFKVAIL